MDDKQAKKLGNFLRKRRETKGLSTRQLAAICDVPDSTIVRFELGAYSAPSPDKLARIAEALNLSLADVYALAEYAVPGDLPSPTLYLRTKYRDLPSRRLADLQKDLDRVFRRHGVEPSAGPQVGQDELPEQPRKKSSTPRKGGKR